MEGQGAGEGAGEEHSSWSSRCHHSSRLETAVTAEYYCALLLVTGDCAEYCGLLAEYYRALLLVTADCGLLQTLRIITGYCRTAELRTTAHYYWLLETVQSLRNFGLLRPF